MPTSGKAGPPTPPTGTKAAGIRDGVAERVRVRGLRWVMLDVGVDVSLPLGLALAEGVAVSVRLRVADGDGDADGVGVALPVAASEAARAPAIGGWDGA